MTTRTTYLTDIRIPIEDLRETYDEVVRVGSQREVANQRGWNQAKVRHRVLSYMRHAGIEGDPPGIVSRTHAARGSLSHSGQGARTLHRILAADLAAANARLAAVEAENTDLRERIADLEAIAARFDRIDAAIAALASRPIGVVTHRRVKDGGVGGKRELRAIRDAA